MNLLKRQNTLDKIIQYKIQIVIEILFGNIRYFFMLIFFYKVQVCHQTCRREPSSRSASHKNNQFVPSSLEMPATSTHIQPAQPYRIHMS
jgi:hypothetical protein